MTDSFLSAHDQISKVRSGLTTAKEIVAQSLDRIAEIDSSGYTLNSVIALSPDPSQTRAIDAGLPLAGLPVL
ncbi:MAG: amidase, partial [Actinobacteria bacterium]|nr:amidase [Actinomycetota bacterium]